jgi:hypothetical protein
MKSNMAHAALAAVALAAAAAATPSHAEDLFGPIHVAVNRHEYRGPCPAEILFTGTINFVQRHHGFVFNYSWERSDGGKSQVNVVHVQPGQRSMVVREPWRLGGHGQRHDVSVTLRVNSGNTHLRESSPVVHVECR